MRSSRLSYCFSAFCCFLQLFQVEGENVARGKRVLAVATWKESLTDGKLQNSVISPDAVQYPFYAVDLGAAYKLTEIKLYAQNQATFQNQGIKENFNVSTYGDFAIACELQLKKWDPLAKNIQFKKQGEGIVLKPKKSVQYIIIWRHNAKFPGIVKPIVMGEVMAYGKKERDTKPKIPADDKPEDNYYKATRKAVIGKQSKLRVEQAKGGWTPNATLTDVPFSWYNNRINAMATKRDKGRVIVIQGEQFVSKLMKDSSYAQLRTSFKSWLSPGAKTAQFHKISEAYKKNDIIIITRNDKFDVNKIYKKIISGENAAIIGYIAKDKKDDATTLIEKLKITFYRHNEHYDPRDINLQDKIDSDQFISLAYVIKRYVNSWKAFRTEAYKDKYSWEEKDSSEVQAQLKKLVQKYGRLMEFLAPCEIYAYKRDSKTVTALINYNDLLNIQNGDTITPLPGYQRNPGTVDDKMKTETVKVRVKADFTGKFYPTGAYAKPGKRFRWKVLKNSKSSFSNMLIRVNAQTDRIGRLDEMTRWPSVASSRQMTQSGQWASAHGGPIFLELDQGTDLTIQFENVYRHAHVDVRDSNSISSFGSKLQQYKGVPWLIVMGDSMYSMLHIRSTIGRSSNDIVSSAKFFDNCIKIMHNYRGTKYEQARPEVFVADVETVAGWGHSGYPWMGHLEWSDLFTNWKEIQNKEHWGFIHEIGHNLQVEAATLKNGEEVTNNIFIMPTTLSLLGKKNDVLNKGDVYTDEHMNEMINAMWKKSTYDGPVLGYYAHLNAIFGEGLLGNVLQKALANDKQLQDKDARTQFWIKQLCSQTGYDLIAYHQLSKFPMNKETISFCQKYPCFMPNDVITKRANQNVDKVLKSYGRQCTRSTNKKVKFNGDIKRGMNKLRPRVVFIQ